jgi:cytochrome c-type biogenesis protein CcmH
MRKTAALALGLALSAAAAAPAQEPSPAPSWPAAELAAGDARRVLGDPAGMPVSGSVLDARTDEVAALLRCPVCQGLSVADSPSTMAQNMKKQVRDLLAQGYDGQQVLAYYERSYGEFVRLQPPLRGINWLLWLAPAIALAGGGLVFARMTRKRGAAGSAAAPAPAAAGPPGDPVLERYRERVRALAYGEGEPGRAEKPAVTPGERR